MLASQIALSAGASFANLVNPILLLITHYNMKDTDGSGEFVVRYESQRVDAANIFEASNCAALRRLSPRSVAAPPTIRGWSRRASGASSPCLATAISASP